MRTLRAGAMWNNNSEMNLRSSNSPFASRHDLLIRNECNRLDPGERDLCDVLLLLSKMLSAACAASQSCGGECGRQGVRIHRTGRHREYYPGAIRESDLTHRIEFLEELNIQLELLRVLWRIAQGKHWISAKQCLHVNRMIDEIGRMIGA